MDDDDSRKRKNHLQLDPPSNSRPAIKRKYPLEPEHDESDTIDIVTEDGIPLAISNTPCTTLMNGDFGNETTSSVVDDDLLSMVPLELSYMILSYVGDYKNAMLVCRRWKSLVDDGIASGMLLGREELALIELKPLGVDSLDITRLGCRWMGLESIPDSVGALTSLEWLNLAWNALASIPDSIGSLTKLKGLYLHHNRLTCIPDALRSLTNLTHLNLSDQKSGVKLSRPPLPSSCRVRL